MIARLGNFHKLSPAHALNMRCSLSLTILVMRALFIQVKDTPNPNFMKFMPTGQTVMESGTLDITAARFSYNSPLAKALFAVDGVTRVFYGRDYISVGKQDEVEWNDLKPQIYEKIEQFYASGEPIIMEKQAPSGNDVKDDDSETVAFIKEILETRIRPTVQNDGGDIEFVDFNEEIGEVSLTLKGVTLKNGIERMLTYYVAEVKSVRAVDFAQD